MIVFDIETGPIEDPLLAELLPKFDPAAVKLGNLKDPDKIAAKLAEARAEHDAETISKAALSAVTGRVLAIGYRSEKATVIAHVAEMGSGEFGLLTQFWTRYAKAKSDRRQMVGHNIAGFDVPFLVRRSWILGVVIPSGITDPSGRYLDRSFRDTMQVWQCGNYRDQFIRLDLLGRALGLGDKTEGVNGGDFARLYWGSQDERAKALEYLIRDVDLTYQVAQRLGIV